MYLHLIYGQAAYTVKILVLHTKRPVIHMLRSYKHLILIYCVLQMKTVIGQDFQRFF